MGRPKGSLNREMAIELKLRQAKGEFQGLCLCGCGATPSLSTSTRMDAQGKRTAFKGLPLSYVKGHEPQYQKGMDNPFTLGKKISTYGYVILWVGKQHPRSDANGYVQEHILVMEKHLGRHLVKANLHGPNIASDEVVHHKDENKENNDLSNLQLMSHSEHQSLHRKAQLAINPNITSRKGTVKRPLTEAEWKWVQNESAHLNTQQKADPLGVSLSTMYRILLGNHGTPPAWYCPREGRDCGMKNGSGY